MNCCVSVGVAVSSWMSLLLLRQQLKLVLNDRRWIQQCVLVQAAKERRVVPKKLLACNTVTDHS